ncbi:hypothetical protein F2P81_002699 [Scophthalmus maximus]|uniref:Uncharacterized protein n=1 Tax=Scophthalmus maximus TaxID=52904 RepID=A0A6A4TRE3_SCOMX|nr:hypothetical protein F2P81_002699 [Scophthalmus maximus]
MRQPESYLQLTLLETESSNTDRGRGRDRDRGRGCPESGGCRPWSGGVPVEEPLLLLLLRLRSVAFTASSLPR